MHQLLQSLETSTNKRPFPYDKSVSQTLFHCTLIWSHPLGLVVKLTSELATFLALMRFTLASVEVAIKTADVSKSPKCEQKSFSYNSLVLHFSLL